MFIIPYSFLEIKRKLYEMMESRILRPDVRIKTQHMLYFVESSINRMRPEKYFSGIFIAPLL